MVIFHIYVKLPEGKTTPNISFGRCLSLSNSTCLVAMFRSTIVTYRTVRWRSLLAKSPCLGASTLQLVLVKCHPCWWNQFCSFHHGYIYMVTDRIMGKKTFNLDRRRLRPIFSIIGFFPIRVQNIPEVIRTFFSIILGGGHYFHNWFFLWNQGARADWPVFP